QDAIEQEIEASQIINQGLIKGMNEVGRLYENEEYFLPEVLICSDVMNAGLEIVEPHLQTDIVAEPIKVVMGVVAGDTHDIGKNLVKIMMEAAGIKVYDLGRDVPLDEFITKAEEVEADFIAMSTLMTTTMEGMKIVIEQLKEEGIRDKYTVLIGGGPISQSFADSIEADLYTADAHQAVRSIKEIAG
ncbi:MAG: corrinoid protein, partial [Bacillota bacterium]